MKQRVKQLIDFLPALGLEWKNDGEIRTDDKNKDCPIEAVFYHVYPELRTAVQAEAGVDFCAAAIGLKWNETNALTTAADGYDWYDAEKKVRKHMLKTLGLQEVVQY